jgi:hypothetical protein
VSTCLAPKDFVAKGIEAEYGPALRHHLLRIGTGLILHRLGLLCGAVCDCHLPAS